MSIPSREIHTTVHAGSESVSEGTDRFSQVRAHVNELIQREYSVQRIFTELLSRNDQIGNTFYLLLSVIAQQRLNKMPVLQDWAPWFHGSDLTHEASMRCLRISQPITNRLEGLFATVCDRVLINYYRGLKIRKSLFAKSSRAFEGFSVDFDHIVLSLTPEKAVSLLKQGTRSVPQHFVMAVIFMEVSHGYPDYYQEFARFMLETVELLRREKNSIEIRTVDRKHATDQSELGDHPDRTAYTSTYLHTFERFLRQIELEFGIRVNFSKENLKALLHDTKITLRKPYNSRVADLLFELNGVTRPKSTVSSPEPTHAAESLAKVVEPPARHSVQLGDLSAEELARIERLIQESESEPKAGQHPDLLSDGVLSSSDDIIY